MIANAAAVARAIVDEMYVGVFAVDAGGVVIAWNRFMELHSGRSAEEILGQNLFACFPELPRTWLEGKLSRVRVIGNSSFVSWRQRPYLFAFPHNRPMTGGVTHMQQDCTFFPVRDESGAIIAVAVTVVDATDACLLQRELGRLVERDALTGIYNRRTLERRLGEEWARFVRTGAPLSLLMFDLDHFKRVNDRYGHLGGDQVLRVVAKRVVAAIREIDTLGRYGGEEFTVVLPSTDANGALVVAERIRRSVADEAVPFEEELIAATVSIGVAEASAASASHLELVEHADRALYACKAAGRDCVRVDGAPEPMRLAG